MIEINYATMNMYGGKSHVWHVNNLRALDEWMSKNGFQEKHQHLLARNGDVTANDVMEAYSKLALSEFMQKAHTITHLPTWLRNFVNMVRTWLHTAASLIKLGNGLASLTKQAQEGKLPLDSGISPDLLENVHTLTNSLRTLWLEKGIEQGTQEAEQLTATSTTSTATAGYQGFLNLTDKEKTEARQKLTISTTPIEKGTKTKTIVQILRDKFVGKQLICINSDIVGGVSRKDCEKMVSKKAVDKSMANSFTFAQHVTAAQGIDELYKYAFRLGEFNDRDNNPHVLSINRFLTPIQIAGQTSTALITVKQTTSDKLYSVELCQLKDLDGISERLSHLYRTGDKIKRPVANIPASRSLDEGIAEFRNYVKEVFPEASQQDNTITGGHSMDVEVPPDKTLVVAHTISTSNAQDALALGFTPHPSVAITNVNSFYKFGVPEESIIFLAGSDMVDPKRNPVDIYYRDAWTGVMPKMHRDVNHKLLREMSQKLWDVATKRRFKDKLKKEDRINEAYGIAHREKRYYSILQLDHFLYAYFCFVEKKQKYDDVVTNGFYTVPSNWLIFCERHPEFEAWFEGKRAELEIDTFYSQATGDIEIATPETLHEHMMVAKHKGNELRDNEPDLHRFDIMANPEYQSVEEVQEQRDNIKTTENYYGKFTRVYNKALDELAYFFTRASKKFPKVLEIESIEQILHDATIETISQRLVPDEQEVCDWLVEYCRNAWGIPYKKSASFNPTKACKAIVKLIEYSINRPTRYMEAVPRRSIKFSEFKTVVVSNNVAEEEEYLMELLQDLGIEIKVFDPTDEEAFINAVKEFALDHGFSADVVEGANRAITPEERELAAKFHAEEAQKAIVCDEPKVYVENAKEAKKAVRETYRKLQGTTVMTTDGKEVGFTGRGFHEIGNHVGDRRVLACVPYLSELVGSANFMYSADNSQKEKAKKSSITKYHYYLNKGNFPQYSAWARRHNLVHGKSGDALVLIAVAEFENGDLFYDLDATDVEIVENEKGTSDHLEVARVPNTSLLNGEAPFKGRLHNLKRYVNYIDNKITGGHSLCVGKKAKNWKSLPGERKFKSVLDGRMRCELDAYQYRLTDKLHALVYPQPEDYEKLEPYYNEIIALVEYFTDSSVGELKKRFDALETSDKRRSRKYDFTLRNYRYSRRG